MMTNEERITQLLAARLAGEASDAEMRELETLLAQDPSQQSRAHILQRYFNDTPAHASADTEQALERTLARIRAAAPNGPLPGDPAAGSTEMPAGRRVLNESITSPAETSDSAASSPESAAPSIRRNRAWISWTAAAAAILLLIGGAWTFWGPSSTKPITFTAFHPETDTVRWLHRQNGKAIRAVLELADGSKIWLNADSKLSYPEQFSAHSREVFLTGEAFFQVASSPQKPFIVHLNKGTIRVLGTSFNVRAYENEPVQTSVSTGKVAFIPKYNDARAPDTFTSRQTKK